MGNVEVVVAVATLARINSLWRLKLSDPNDDMVLEVTVLEKEACFA